MRTIGTISGSEIVEHTDKSVTFPLVPRLMVMAQTANSDDFHAMRHHPVREERWIYLRCFFK